MKKIDWEATCLRYAHLLGITDVSFGRAASVADIHVTAFHEIMVRMEEFYGVDYVASLFHKIVKRAENHIYAGI